MPLRLLDPRLILALGLLAVTAPTARAQTASEAAAIRATALDYA
jgi:hypothetical protein